MEYSGSILGIFTAVRDMIAGGSPFNEPPSNTRAREPDEQIVDAEHHSVNAAMKGVKTDDESASTSHRQRAACGRTDDVSRRRARQLSRLGNGSPPLPEDPPPHFGDRLF